MKLILTPQQKTVLDLYLIGLSRIEIAEGLGLSGRAIEHHLSDLYKKAGVFNGRQLIALFGKSKIDIEVRKYTRRALAYRREIM
jgi:DNA-binding CsgD family transcriptional regulator